nr:hypothetical protein [Tanacetum cinerariifolium]
CLTCDVIFCGSSAIASRAEYASGNIVRYCCHINFSFSPRRPGSAGKTSITPDSIHASGRVHSTGWGEDISDDEVTPGKVTILNGSEEESDWDDDERSGRKNLVIQEKPAKNQQDFLDKYLPQWDDHLATQKQESGLEWKNPFAKKRGKLFSGGYGEYYNSQWTLPLAWIESGVMLVLPADPGLWSEVISRWESITIN